MTEREAYFWILWWVITCNTDFYAKLHGSRKNKNTTTTKLKVILCPQFVIVVIDSTDRERLAVTREELYRMLAHEELSKAAVLIYANKQDLKGSMSAAEISKRLDLTSIKKHQWQIQSCCALTGEG